MSASRRRKTDAQWARCTRVTGADMAALDAKLTATVNGDGGGSYGGADSVINGVGVGVSGPWIIDDGTYVETDGTDASQIVFGKKTDDDAFVYAADHADRTKDLVQGFTAGNVLPQLTLDALIIHPAGNDRGSWMRALRAGARVWLQLRVHDGSTLARVRFHFRVSFPRGTTPPERASRFRVVRVGGDGTIEPLRTSDATTDADGFQGPTPATGTAWNSGGDVQQFDYVPTRFDTVDLANYVYLAEVIEESGEGDGTYGGIAGEAPLNEYISAVARCTNINVLANRR